MLTICDGAPLDERPRIAISAYVVTSSATVPTAPATAPINALDNMSLLLCISYVHGKEPLFFITKEGALLFRLPTTNDHKLLVYSLIPDAAAAWSCSFDG